MSYTTRAYREGDEKQLPKLSRAVWGEWRSPDYWNWLYRENPEHFSIIRVAENGNELVAQIAAVPMMMRAGNEFLGCLGIDAVTLPKHRGQGIMKRLMQEAAAETVSRGISVGFGIEELGQPMERVSKRALKAEIRTTSMRDFILVLNPIALLKRRGINLTSRLGAILLGMTHKRRELSPPDNVLVKQVFEFDEFFDELWKTVAPSLGRTLVIKKSSEYLKWRYGNHPENKYMIWTATENGIPVGYAVARLEQTEESNRGLVADVFGSYQKREALGALVASAAKYFDDQEAELVRSQFSDGHACASILGSVGFVSRATNAGLHFNVGLPNAAVDEAWLSRKENSMIAWGDYDMLC